MTAEMFSVRFVALTARRAVEVPGALDAISPPRFGLVAANGISAGTAGALIIANAGVVLELPARVVHLEPIEQAWRVVGKFAFLPAETRAMLEAFIDEREARDGAMADLRRAVEVAG